MSRVFWKQQLLKAFRHPGQANGGRQEWGDTSETLIILRGSTPGRKARTKGYLGPEKRVANEGVQDCHRLLTKISIRLPHNIALYIFTTLRGAAGQIREHQTKYSQWADWPKILRQGHEPRTKPEMEAGKERGTRLDAKMEERWTSWPEYLASTQQHDLIAEDAWEEYRNLRRKTEDTLGALRLVGVNRTTHGKKHSQGIKGRRKHNLLFSTPRLEPPGMDATWAYMDQFVWKHPLKSWDADTILVDRDGHTRVQAYEMVM